MVVVLRQWSVCVSDMGVRDTHPRLCFLIIVCERVPAISGKYDTRQISFFDVM